MTKPLEGLTVLEFSQFLSGPYAGLRLADLGARVIKIERPEVGDLCRNLYISDTDLEGDSTLFHAINRNKESFAANLKDAKDIELVKKLKSNGTKVWSVEQTENSTDLKEIKQLENFEKHALIFGNEINGVDQKVINCSSEVIEIEQYGTKHSLNISIAAGILIWHFFNLLRKN